jgi:hypothetical protein
MAKKNESEALEGRTTSDGAESAASAHSELTIHTDHANHCFIVMPFGRTADEERWYRGWYQAVIEPAVRTSGFEPILSASEEHPAADILRRYL